MNRQNTGRKGENLAAMWLQQHEFVLLERNWKARRKEIDLIACKDHVLHFIEVKTRMGLGFGNPEEQVNGKKLYHLRIAAEEYLTQHPQWRRIQFDVLAILLNGNFNTITFLEDVG
ncbi:YraN family protein [Flavihumibacter petaseus]|uniref:UPF0102 protein FPE01S_02_00730 n=1 Tax=Flavihumibacter petaseus NBRC 106054 TaxID=1220578 RepID=A0A0E9MZM0_9BACT|nr:YraN family protein [Flavihumibacter petaseus]GAO42968.1 hypothetical protein FPE01S_02_00730 [Flavihumibacter petaseus NBRC 106054]